MAVKTVTGFCKFCGQSKVVQVNDNASNSQAIADGLATDECTCKEAIADKEERMHILDAEYAAEELYGDSHPEIVPLLKQAIPLALNREFQSMILTLGDGVRARLAVTGGGTIKVEKTETTKTSLES